MENLQSYAVYTLSSHFCPKLNAPVPALEIHVRMMVGSSVTFKEVYNSFGTIYLSGGIEKVLLPRVKLSGGNEFVALVGRQIKAESLLPSNWNVPLSWDLTAKNWSLRDDGKRERYQYMKYMNLQGNSYTENSSVCPCKSWHI